MGLSHPICLARYAVRPLDLPGQGVASLQAAPFRARYPTFAQGNALGVEHRITRIKGMGSVGRLSRLPGNHGHDLLPVAPPGELKSHVGSYRPEDRQGLISILVSQLKQIGAEEAWPPFQHDLCLGRVTDK